MAALKSSSLKSSLKARARDNAIVTQGTRKESTTLKQGTPNEHSRKHLDGEVPVVGVSVGITKNMENYESLRVDVWLTDKVAEGEDVISAYARVTKVCSEVLTEIVGEFI